jgi:hypothetical protein
MLAVVLIAQTVYFFALLHHPVQPEGDNTRYEMGAWNLASARGYSLPLTGYGASSDPEVKGWVCARHPDSCLADGTAPSAMYLPGYPIFAAGLYKIFGRSMMALAGANLVLLWLLFILFERVAARWLDAPGYLFAMVVGAFYPFLAREAIMIMSDHLHAVMWFSALAAFMMLRPGLSRGVAFGGLLALATLTRPYSMFIFPIVWIWPSVRRGMQVGRREWVAGVLAFALPFVLWTARNYYWFGRFMPFTTGGAGILLYHTTLEWDYDQYDPKNYTVWVHQQEAKFGGPDGLVDLASRKGSQLQQAEAIKRIKQHPWKFVGRVAVHVPKVWISFGSNEEGLSRALPLLIVYLGGLWLLGLVGAWLVRHDARWHALLLAIGVNWAFLLPFPGEARRTLPMRLPMLLLGAVAVSHAWRWWISRRSRRAEPAR